MIMEPVTKDELFRSRLPEDTVEIPGIGTVRVRGMNRAEAMLMQEADTLAAKERKMLKFGMVEPKLSEADAGRWQAASPASEIEPVTDRITELSGMSEGASKSDLSESRAESGT